MSAVYPLAETVSTHLTADDTYKFSRDGYIIVPCALILDPHLTDSGLRLLLAYLMNTRNDHHRTWEPQETTATKLHRSTDAVGRALANIKAHPGQIAGVRRDRDPENGQMLGNTIDLGKVWLMIDTAKGRAKEHRARKQGVSMQHHPAQSRRGRKADRLSKPDTAIPQKCGDINTSNACVSKNEQQTADETPLTTDQTLTGSGTPSVVVPPTDKKELSETDKATVNDIHAAIPTISERKASELVQRYGSVVCRYHLRGWKQKPGRRSGFFLDSIAQGWKYEFGSSSPSTATRPDAQTPAKTTTPTTDANLARIKGWQSETTTSDGSARQRFLEALRRPGKQEGASA